MRQMSVCGGGKEQSVTEKKEAIAYCLTLEDAYEDYPFHDPNWCVIRHKNNQKVFAWIFDRNGHVWINVKCDPMLGGSLRMQEGIHPAYHMNKSHWISIVLDGSVSDNQITPLLELSYDSVAPKRRKRALQPTEE